MGELEIISISNIYNKDYNYYTPLFLNRPKCNNYNLYGNINMYVFQLNDKDELYIINK